MTHAGLDWSCVSRLFCAARQQISNLDNMLNRPQFRGINNWCSLIHTTLMILFSPQNQMTVRPDFNGAEVICGLVCCSASACCFNEACLQFTGKANTIILRHLMLFLRIAALTQKYNEPELWVANIALMRSESSLEGLQFTLLALNYRLTQLQSVHFYSQIRNHIILQCQSLSY